MAISKTCVAKIKIDKSFVKDMAEPQRCRDRALRVGLGHNLGLGVIAEGVETRGLGTG